MSKNKLAILVGVIVLVVAGIGAAIFIMNQNKSDGTPQGTGNSSNNSSYTAVAACDALTLDEAKTILGEAATAGDSSPASTTDSLSVDTCSYTNNATAISDLRIISIMTRSALDKDGMDSNTEAFGAGGSANMSGATAVEGYGDKAFWDPTTYQLAVLDGTVWYGIVYGGTDPTTNTLEDTKLVAELVIN